MATRVACLPWRPPALARHRLAAAAAVAVGALLTHAWTHQHARGRWDAWGAGAAGGAMAAIAYALVILLGLYVPAHGPAALVGLVSLVPVAIAGTVLGLVWAAVDVLVERGLVGQD